MDLSDANDNAAETIAPQALDTPLLQADLMQFPFPEREFDVALSEGVSHYKLSSRDAIRAAARLALLGGLGAICVCANRGPAGEFTDDHIRAAAANLSPNATWERLIRLTELGTAVDELHAAIELGVTVAPLIYPKDRTT